MLPAIGERRRNPQTFLLEVWNGAGWVVEYDMNNQINQQFVHVPDHVQSHEIGSMNITAPGVYPTIYPMMTTATPTAAPTVPYPPFRYSPNTPSEKTERTIKRHRGLTEDDMKNLSTARPAIFEEMLRNRLCVSGGNGSIFDTMKEYTDWMDDNLNGFYHISVHTSYGLNIAFEHESEMMQFALTFK